MEELQRNTILCGDVDCLCLVCEEHITTAEQARAHVQSARHRSKLAANHYVEAFAEDRIRKIYKLFYCEFCNLTLPSKPKVLVHVSTENHQLNKKSPHKTFPSNHLTRSGDGLVLAFDDLLLGVEAWNGIADEYCFLCDTETDDVAGHIKNTGHILKLIATKTHSGVSNELFRKIDDELFHCLTCNEALPQSESVRHWDSQNHEILYTKCRTAKLLTDKQAKVNTTKDGTNENNLSVDNELVSKIDSKITSNVSDAYATNNDDDKKNCTQENSSIEKEFPSTTAEIINISADIKDLTLDSVEKNTETPADAIQMAPGEISTYNDKCDVEDADIKDVTLDEACAVLDKNTETSALDGFHDENVINEENEIKILIKENKITYNKNNSNAFCRICNIKIPSSLNCLKEHVSGNKHMKNSSKILQADVTEQNNPDKTKAGKIIPTVIRSKLSLARSVTTKKYIRSAVALMELDKMVINECIIVNCDTFQCFLYGNRVVACDACKESVRSSLINVHVNDDRHIDAVLSIKVLVYDETEFIREISPNCYQCGICHKLIVSINGMEAHLQSQEHFRKKEIAQNELRKWLPTVRGHLRTLSPFEGPMSGVSVGSSISSPSSHARPNLLMDEFQMHAMASIFGFGRR